MSEIIGKSGFDWGNIHTSITHIARDSVGYVYGYFIKDGKLYESFRGSLPVVVTNYCGDKLISKEEDLGMNKKEVLKQVSCIEDLQTGMFVFMQGGYSAYVNKDDRGRIGFLFTNQHSGVNYVMQSGFDGLEYSPNKDINITHWGYSLEGERHPVATSEAKIKIKELEATIALAQKQLQEYKGMK